MSFWSEDYWAPRKSATQRRAEAARKIQEAARRGKPMAPVVLAGRKIAQTFWGKAWCDNLERYRDFAYRLERGRSYLRSGSVIDLQIRAGKVIAKVSGSSDYDVAIEIDAVERPAWRAIQRACAGGIGSRLDLLAGRLSETVMVQLCADRTGMFPAPSSIRFTCSCPDYASMCKHVAAAMYGVGARLDQSPELIFTLRQVSADELLASALSELPAQPSPGRALATGGLAALFGIELADPTTSSPAPITKRAPITPRASTAKRASTTKRAPTTKRASNTKRAPPKAHATPATKRAVPASTVRRPSDEPRAARPTRAGSASRTRDGAGAPPRKRARAAKPPTRRQAASPQPRR